MKSLAPPVVVLLLLTMVAPAVAQPALSSFWPFEVGRTWEFDARVEGPFTSVETGTVTQTVVGQSQLSAGTTVWCFDVASTLSRKHPAMLLAVPPCAQDAGLFVDETLAIGAWSDATTDWAWWWIPADLSPGTAFRLQIRTPLADDSYLNGEVRTVDGSVTTPLGSFADAVIVDYVVDLGESEISGGGGNVLGTVRFQTVGWVAFVSGVGPVASAEVFAPSEIDCPDCPPVVLEPVTTTMELRATTSVGTDRPTFGSLKARY